MDRETLRLILIVIGVLIIAGILLFGNPERKRRQVSRRGPAREGRQSDAAANLDDDVVQQELADLGQLISRERQTDRGEDRDEAPEETPAEPPAPRKPAPPPPEKIVTLFVRARGEHRITGVELLDAAFKAGLAFGEMAIFHRLDEGSEQPVFSMANLVKPGYFDKDAWPGFETPGVSLFMALPGPLDALDAWDAMLATGQRLASLLRAEVLDDRKCPITRQKIAEIREALRDYDRKKADAGPGAAS